METGLTLPSTSSPKKYCSWVKSTFLNLSQENKILILVHFQWRFLNLFVSRRYLIWAGYLEKTAQAVALSWMGQFRSINKLLLPSKFWDASSAESQPRRATAWLGAPSAVGVLEQETTTDSQGANQPPPSEWSHTCMKESKYTKVNSFFNSTSEIGQNLG